MPAIFIEAVTILGLPHHNVVLKRQSKFSVDSMTPRALVRVMQLINHLAHEN